MAAIDDFINKQKDGARFVSVGLGSGVGHGARAFKMIMHGQDHPRQGERLTLPFAQVRVPCPAAMHACRTGIRDLFEAHANALDARHPVAFDVSRDKDAFGTTNQQFARHETDVARILGIVAIIAQHQIMILWNDYRAEVSLCGDARQNLDAMRASARRLAHAQCRNAVLAINRFQYRLQIIIQGDFAIDDELFIAQFHCIARQRDQALDEPRIVLR